MANKNTKKKLNAEAKRAAAEKAARTAKLQWIAVIGVAVLIIGGFVAFSIIEAIPEDGDVGATTWDLPALDNDPDGDGRIRLDEFRGQPVVLNFYADWCIACESELPAFAAVAEDFEEQIHFVHVNSQESGDWRRLVDEFGTDHWAIARDINGTRANGSGLHGSLGGTGMPITAFYDANGNLVNVNNGTMNEGSLRSAIASGFGIVS
jgi:cytochrome c biogenesis protein CcmG/thiol:disulfide interchange protein DsbE